MWVPRLTTILNRLNHTVWLWSLPSKVPLQKYHCMAAKVLAYRGLYLLPCVHCAATSDWHVLASC
jgi:hypothetical protein